jgi:hypothetical protein
MTNDKEENDTKIEDINQIMESKTIKPSFSIIHAIMTLILFKNQEQGMGRYRLCKELGGLEEGKTKTLLTRLKQYNYIITDNRINGHIISPKGRMYVEKIFEKITIPTEPKFSFKNLIVGDFCYYCVIRNSGHLIKSGIEQRDQVMKMGGIGSTILLFKNSKFSFPQQSDEIKKNLIKRN